MGVETVHVPGAGLFGPRPDRLLHAGKDDPVGNVLWLVVGPHVPVAVGAVLRLTGRPEPRVVDRGVIDHQVDDDLQAVVARGPRELDEVAGTPEPAVYVVEVGDVVSVVAVRGGIERVQPDRADAQRLEVVEAVGQAAEITDAVAVGVHEGLDVETVDDGILVPEIRHGSSADGQASTWRLGQRVPAALAFACPRSIGVTGRIPFQIRRRGMEPITLLDFAGVAVFAATGALAASRQELDLIGFLFLASVTGVGGGTVRDLILDVPVFWIEDHAYVLVCAAVAVAAVFAAPALKSRYKLLLWLDAIGLAAFCVLGARKGLAITDSPVTAIIMGVMTGTVGGILRDVLAREPSVLLRQEIYVTAAIAGSAAFILMERLGAGLQAAAITGFVLALAVRGGALHFGWTLPRYRSRPGRHPDDIG